MICDLAETYHILNYKELSPDLVATLVFGLRDNSRVKMRLSKTKLTLEQALFAMMVDQLRFQSWTHSKEAHKGRGYKEKSILKALQEEPKEKDELEVFDDAESLMEYLDSFNEDKT